MITETSFSRFMRAIRSPIGNRRLRGKLFLVYLLVTILPISFLVVYSYQTIRQQLIQQALVSVESSVDQINNNLTNKLNMYAQTATMLYMDSQLRNYLVYRYGDNYMYYLDAYDYINSTFYKIMAMNPELKSISIYTDNDSLNSDGYFIRHLADLPDEVRRKAMGAQGNIAALHLEATEGDGSSILLVRSLNYLSLNYPYGILTMEISKRELYSLIEKENTNKTIVIADENGSIVVSGFKDKTVRHLSELDASPDRIVSKQMPNGWRTVAVLSYGSLLKDAQRSSARMLILSLACIAAAIVMIYLTSHFMTKRLERLLQLIRKVERGSFDLSVEPMGGDEIGRVAFALNKMAATIQELIRDTSRKELARNEAEMTSLQAQITPHFLYNTLASISALAIKNNQPEVHKMADDLARFYRISLHKGKKFITLEQEFKLTEHYLSIQQTRFKGRFVVHYVADETLFPYTTLKLIIQPFIENCLNHAIWDDESHLNIVIKLAADAGDLRISVIDDGMGMPRGMADKWRAGESELHGYGMHNVDKRIKLAYGEQYGVQVYSRPAIGTSVHIRIPRTSRFA